ncbi:MAG: hypothetical protein EOL86_10220 [Deltaproteobacteria bacterium]|nr:hypothetical protein [Deltaproteobacteria bacterium]
MPTIFTPFGPVNALPGVEYYSDGQVRSCIAATSSPLDTPLGVLMPQFTANTLRKRQLPVIAFHPNGMIRTLPLEDETNIPTPIGEMPAEQVTFYEDGALKRVFPLNGALSGYWTQEDEGKLVRSLALDTPLGRIHASLVSAYFAPNGRPRSLTLWPGTTLAVPGPVGSILTRVGISWDDSGVLASLEPAGPTVVPTPIGPLVAYDSDAVGICGDRNSLRFRQNGAVLGLVTTAHAFDVVLENGRTRRLSPLLRINPCDGESREPAPIAVEFGGGQVAFFVPGQPKLVVPEERVTVSCFVMPLPAFGTVCRLGAGTLG